MEKYPTETDASIGLVTKRINQDYKAEEEKAKESALVSRKSDLRRGEPNGDVDYLDESEKCKKKIKVDYSASSSFTSQNTISSELTENNKNTQSDSSTVTTVLVNESREANFMPSERQTDAVEINGKPEAVLNAKVEADITSNSSHTHYSVEAAQEAGRHEIKAHENIDKEGAYTKNHQVEEENLSEQKRQVEKKEVEVNHQSREGFTDEKESKTWKEDDQEKSSTTNENLTGDSENVTKDYVRENEVHSQVIQRTNLNETKTVEKFESSEIQPTVLPVITSKGNGAPLLTEVDETRRDQKCSPPAKTDTNALNINNSVDKIPAAVPSYPSMPLPVSQQESYGNDLRSTNKNIPYSYPTNLSMTAHVTDTAKVYNHNERSMPASSISVTQNGEEQGVFMPQIPSFVEDGTMKDSMNTRKAPTLGQMAMQVQVHAQTKARKLQQNLDLLDRQSDKLLSVCPSGQEATGRWKRHEHEKFLNALKKYGKEWKRVAAAVETRTVVQTRTHAQKYFQKLQKQMANGYSLDDALEMNLVSDDEEDYPRERRSKNTKGNRGPSSKGKSGNQKSPSQKANGTRYSPFPEPEYNGQNNVSYSSTEDMARAALSQYPVPYGVEVRREDIPQFTQMHHPQPNVHYSQNIQCSIPANQYYPPNLQTELQHQYSSQPHEQSQSTGYQPQYYQIPVQHQQLQPVYHTLPPNTIMPLYSSAPPQSATMSPQRQPQPLQNGQEQMRSTAVNNAPQLSRPYIMNQKPPQQQNAHPFYTAAQMGGVHFEDQSQGNQRFPRHQYETALPPTYTTQPPPTVYGAPLQNNQPTRGYPLPPQSYQQSR